MGSAFKIIVILYTYTKIKHPRWTLFRTRVKILGNADNKNFSRNTFENL